jgi:hypothetical protein
MNAPWFNNELGGPAIGVAKMIGLRRTANVSATAVGPPGQARRVLTARPVPLGSMHQHPDHDSDHAQRSHDGEGDKATLERIHLRRPVPGRTAPARGLRALRPRSSGYARCSPASLRNSPDQKSFLDG